MQSFFRKFKSSAKELKSVYTLTFTAMLLVIKLLLDLYNIRITISPNLRITFGFLALAMIGMFFGPVVGMAAGFISDVLGYILNSGGGAFFPGYTLTAILSGLIWGFVLYQKPIKIWRFFVAKLIINIFLNMGLNSVWIYILRGKSIFADLPLRIFKNIAMLPIETILLFTIAKAVYTIYQRSKSMTKTQDTGSRA